MKKVITIIGCACLFAVLAVAKLHAQAPVLAGMQVNFNNYNLNVVTEKIFVHTDKNAYTAGELMWFKIYNVDGTNHQPSTLSKVVYVEVLDEHQNPVMQAKVAMVDGKGSGSLYIPVTVTTGNFLLRAYTSWMKNFSPDYYFNKQLTIINPLRSPGVQAKANPVNYDIRFFPEGGNMVNDITSVLAFKATDEWGRGVDFKGAIVDKNNDTIVRFQPYKFGMGHFTFKPEAANTYRAVVRIGAKTIQKELPPVNSNGYVMNVKDNGAGQLLVSVNTNMPTGNIYLFVHTRNSVKIVQTAATDNGTAHFDIDKSKLGDGISHFTLFNNERQPVCERLYFKRPVNGLSINAAAGAMQYNTRKKVDVAISAEDKNNKQVAADLSLSVYRVDSLQHLQQDDIQSYLWLSSDLKGNIESPGYYFQHNDAATDEAMDNLMLTQGWSRFNWNDISTNKAPEFNFLPEYNGPIISAKIYEQLTNKPANDVIAYLAVPGKRTQMYASKSDSLGRLIFNMKDFYGPGEIVVETNTLVDTNYRIDVLSPFSEQYAKAVIPPLTISPSMQSAIEQQSLAMQVQNIYNGNKLRQFYDLNIDSNAFYGTPYKTYLLDNYTRFTTMEEVMREYVSEVNIARSKDNFHIKVLNGNRFLNEGDPMVMIDGVPFFDMNKLFAVDPLKIRKLEDVPFTYYWGPSVEEGIFSFTSYKGDLGGAEIDPHAVVLDYEGLEQQREFYSPVYDTEKAVNSRIPDFRNVLYWSPNITTSIKGKNNISFYTSDQTGKYIGVLQGLTVKGDAGSQYFTFEVGK